jgi:hypothetical protein
MKYLFLFFGKVIKKYILIGIELKLSKIAT